MRCKLEEIRIVGFSTKAMSLGKSERPDSAQGLETKVERKADIKYEYRCLKMILFSRPALY